MGLLNIILLQKITTVKNKEFLNDFDKYVNAIASQSN